MTEDLQNLVLDVLLQQAPGFAGSRISYRNSRISVNTDATNNDSFVKGKLINEFCKLFFIITDI
jgi:hypothetical protein